MTLPVWAGRALRWYLVHGRHPLKNYIVGHYWKQFCRPRIWIDYDQGSRLSVSLGDYLQQRIFFDGYYEQDLVAWLKANLQPTDVMWDIGANIGSISIVAARHCRRVVAFEPDPRSLTLLREHVAASRLTNVDVEPIALSDRDGAATLHQASSANTGMTSLVPGRGETVGAVSVSVRRADDFLAEHPDLAPTIVKIDVEGGEDLVLRGADRLLHSSPPRAIIFEARSEDGRQPACGGLTDRLREARFAVEPFGQSDPAVDDGMRNFLARWQPSGASAT